VCLVSTAKNTALHPIFGSFSGRNNFPVTFTCLKTQKAP
jgi:hypothetical protein